MQLFQVHPLLNGTGAGSVGCSSLEPQKVDSAISFASQHFCVFYVFCAFCPVISEASSISVAIVTAFKVVLVMVIEAVRYADLSERSQNCRLHLSHY